MVNVFYEQSYGNSWLHCNRNIQKAKKSTQSCPSAVETPREIGPKYRRFLSAVALAV